MKDQKKIKLVHPILGVKEFGEQHAENLMSLPNNGGWEYHKEDEPVLIENKPIELNAPSIGNKGTSKRKESKDNAIKGNKPTE